MSRRLNREYCADVPWAKSGMECPCEAKGDSASILFASSLNYSCAHVWAREDFWQLAGLWIIFMHCAAHDLEATLVVLTSWIATRVVNRRLYSALMYDWNTRVRAGLGSSWAAHVLFSVRVPD